MCSSDLKKQARHPHQPNTISQSTTSIHLLWPPSDKHIECDFTHFFQKLKTQQSSHVREGVLVYFKDPIRSGPQLGSYTFITVWVMHACHATYIRLSFWRVQVLHKAETIWDPSVVALWPKGNMELAELAAVDSNPSVKECAALL